MPRSPCRASAGWRKNEGMPVDASVAASVINRLAGRVWVDEREYAIMKCALHLIESINIVGGIVGEAQRFEYGFERERTEEGVWYVKDSKWQLEGREILVHRKADYHETVTEVRKVKQ